MSDQLVIRTMKDDIAEMNSVPSVPPASTPKQKREKSQPPVFSLPSKQTPLQSSEPATSAKKRKNILIGVSCIALFFVIVGGAVYGYMKWVAGQAPTDTPNQDAPLAQVIPQEALVLVDYNIETESNRAAVRQLWLERSAGSATEGASGNPTSLLGVPDLTHIYYVAMPDIQVPFAVLKKTDGTEQYVAQQRDVLVQEINGWYVLHATDVAQYANALLKGSATEQSLLLTPSTTANYLARYAMSAEFVSQQFNEMAATTIGLTQPNGLVFNVLASTSDGTIRASAYVAGVPSGNGVIAPTSELLSLLPSDLTFAHLGLNFAEEINTLQSQNASLNASILAQPAVRQFISSFNTPYTIFERKGSDGVRDIGLVVALPASLRQTLRTGEPVVEQALPALIPLVVGKTLGIQVAFNDGLYNAVPLRYVNINGQTQTLDYTIGDNYVLISSSREGLSALIDTSLAGKQGLSTQEPWKSLGDKAGQALSNKPFVVGSLTAPVLKSLLPVSPNLNFIPILVSSEKTNTGVDIQAVLLTK